MGAVFGEAAVSDSTGEAGISVENLAGGNIRIPIDRDGPARVADDGARTAQGGYVWAIGVGVKEGTAGQDDRRIGQGILRAKAEGAGIDSGNAGASAGAGKGERAAIDSSGAGVRIGAAEYLR